MSDTAEKLDALVRETPLLERLKLVSASIGQMCSEGRPPKMSIPVRHTDEDYFATLTCRDAIEHILAIEKALKGVSHELAVRAYAGENTCDAGIKWCMEQADNVAKTALENRDE